MSRESEFDPSRRAVAPAWMAHLTDRLCGLPAEYFSRYLPPRDGGGRASAVLMLFGPRAGGGQEVVLTERSTLMRSHPGQVSFPGGRLDGEDAGPVSAAMREAREEIGLSPKGVEIVAELPQLYLPVSNSTVTPVLAWWASPTPISVCSPDEVDRVLRVAVTDLTCPANRFTVVHPSGYRGPGFETPEVYIWGFTAGLLAKVFELGALDQPWDHDQTRPLPDRFNPRLPDPQPGGGAS